jgi:hypothetical protein
LVVMDYKAMKNPQPWSLILNLQMGQSNILNKTKASDKQWQSYAEPGYGALLEMEYFITKNMGLATGIGYNVYLNSATLNNFNNYGVNNLERVDKDNETYYLYNEVQLLEEFNQVKTLSFPIRFKLHFRPGKKLGFYTDFGMKLMYVIDASVNANGTSIWQAYYPLDHVVIYNVPEYGYDIYNLNSDYSVIDYKKFQYSIIASAGISFNIKKELTIDLGFYIDKGISDLKYEKPSHPADFLNTVGEIDKTILQCLGFNVGIRYHLAK